MALIGKIAIIIWTAIIWLALISFIISLIKNKKIKIAVFVMAVIFFSYGLFNIATELFSPPPKPVKTRPSMFDGRGCCSQHSGVCGCSDGFMRCCDDTISATCQCGH